MHRFRIALVSGPAALLLAGGCWCPSGPPPAEIDPVVVSTVPQTVAGTVGGDDATDTVTFDYVGSTSLGLAVACVGTGVTYDAFQLVPDDDPSQPGALIDSQVSFDRPCDTGNTFFSVDPLRDYLRIVVKGGSEATDYSLTITAP